MEEERQVRYILSDDTRPESLQELCQRQISHLRRSRDRLRALRDEALTEAVDRGRAVEDVEARLAAVETEYAAAFPSEVE